MSCSYRCISNDIAIFVNYVLSNSSECLFIFVIVIGCFELCLNFQCSLIISAIHKSECISIAGVLDNNRLPASLADSIAPAINCASGLLNYSKYEIVSKCSNSLGRNVHIVTAGAAVSNGQASFSASCFLNFDSYGVLADITYILRLCKLNNLAIKYFAAIFADYSSDTRLLK